MTDRHYRGAALWLSLFILALPVAASANTALVFGPRVSPTEQGVDGRLVHVPSSDGRSSAWFTRFHYQVPVADTLRARVMAQGRQVGSDGLDYQFSRFELQWMYLDAAPDGWTAALRFEVQENSNAADRVRVAWTGQLGLSERWAFTANVLAGREFGSGARSGVLLETRAKLSFRIPDAGTLGLEMYNFMNSTADNGSFDTQDHEIGVIYSGRLTRDWMFDAGVLAGLSDRADDQTFRFYVSRNF